MKSSSTSCGYLFQVADILMKSLPRITLSGIVSNLWRREVITLLDVCAVSDFLERTAQWTCLLRNGKLDKHVSVRAGCTNIAHRKSIALGNFRFPLPEMSYRIRSLEWPHEKPSLIRGMSTILVSKTKQAIGICLTD